MISILPEHAPPGKEDRLLKLIVADDIVADFPEHEAAYTLNIFAEDVVKDIKSLETMGILPGGKVDPDSLNMALQFMVVTEQDESEVSKKYTEMFHKFIIQKFMWNIV